MAVTAKLYGNFTKALLNKEVDFDTDTIKVMLCTSSYTPDQDTHDYVNDVTNEVGSGNGYTTGGATLANKSVTYTAGTNVMKIDADDVTWSNITIPAYYAVIYCDTGVAGTSALIGYIDVGETIYSSSGAFTITWDANGIFTFTIS